MSSEVLFAVSFCFVFWYPLRQDCLEAHNVGVRGREIQMAL